MDIIRVALRRFVVVVGIGVIVSVAIGYPLSYFVISSFSQLSLGMTFILSIGILVLVSGASLLATGLSAWKVANARPVALLRGS